ncbi:endonuclease [Gracilibacillus salinarum]|uniref:Endonuclease n=1 Tax=Gracilibacillus salinarum TaxID=2932255 RepID=A0ABY4GMI9_9BACI|nr:endonuclease [Gracilibacillus salinarum]UOQ85175.1 endonuclease [Gracilibacillus salinarum]
MNVPEADITLYHYICGKLLGDGSITIQKGRKPRFQFTHAAKDYDWSFYCYDKLANNIPLNKPTYKRTVDPRVKKGFTEAYVVQSKTDPIITQLESIWYQQRKKVLPINFIEDFLDVRALAWWYQDDGHLKIDNHIPRKIILSTDSFSKQENQLLILLLKRKFSLHFSLDKQNRIILYDAAQIVYFSRLIKPYMHSSMHRKMLTLPTTSVHSATQRTTIYLPDFISIIQPTKEINLQLDQLEELLNTVKDCNTYLPFYLEQMAFIEKITIKRSYQIVIEPRKRQLLCEVSSYTGYRLSTIVAICFQLTNKKITLPSKAPEIGSASCGHGFS